MLDLFAEFDTETNSNNGAKLHFKLKNGDLAYLDFERESPKKPVTVTMLGASSDAAKKHAVSVIRQARLDSKKSRNKKSDDVDTPDTFFDDVAEGQIERLMAVVTSWENIVLPGNKELECTKENVKTLFSKCQELRIQAINFLDDDVNFIKS